MRADLHDNRQVCPLLLRHFNTVRLNTHKE